MDFSKLNFKSTFYKNCKRRRKEEAKICQDCPFREWIEKQEAVEEIKNNLNPDKTILI